MSDVVLIRFACATSDGDAIVEGLRAVTSAPIHVREEQVRGLDFADAGTAERVTGALRRVAIELIVETDEVNRLIESVEGCRRRLPVRWAMLPVLKQGRLA